MATISILPASTAALASRNAAPRLSPYDEVKVLQIGWNVDSNNHRGTNLDRMRAFLTYWGYEVTSIYGDKTRYEAPTKDMSGKMPIPVARGLSGAASCGVTKKYKRMLEGGVQPTGARGAARKKLLIVCYYGHGKPYVIDTNSGQRWLYGCSGERYVAISYWQEYARDNVGATDILFIPETCYGGFDGLLANAQGRKDYTFCETLAAGPGNQTTQSNIEENVYTSRIIGALSRNSRYGLKVQELHDLIYDPSIRKAPGFYKSHGIQGDSILLAPMPNSPAARAMAGQQVQIPPQLVPLPDVPQPHVQLTAADTAFLGTWSDEQKRRLLQMVRTNCNPKLYGVDLNSMFATAAMRQRDSTSAASPYEHKGDWECEIAIDLLTRR